MSYIGKKNGNPNTDFLEAGGELENHDLVNVDSNGKVTSFTSTGIDDNATSTAMTLDSSGEVLVGSTTTAVLANNGIRLNPTGLIDVGRDGDMLARLRRNTSYGDIIQFYKDSTKVGSIGSYLGSSTAQFYISGADTGFKINSTVDKILPSNGSGSDRDNAITLGDTGNRFANLYLGGGVYLGGTGSANYLDDYEEGTWTPSFVNGTVTYGNRSGVYTKVGGLVQASFLIIWSAISGVTAPRITLPFNATSSTNYRGSGALGFMKGVDFNTSVNASWITTANQGDVNLVLNYDNSTPSNGNINDWSSSGEIQGTIVYRTDS